MEEAKETGELSEIERFANEQPKLTVLTDHPLASDEAFDTDTFNLCYKLGPVYDIIRHRGTKTPMAILISGDWGTGKTTAMRWLEGLLEEWNKTGPAGRTKVRPVWFYPWKYDNKDDVRKGLIAEVILNAMTKDATSKDVVEAFKTAAIFVGKSVLDFASATEINLGPVKVSGSCLMKVKKNLKNAVFPEKQYLQPYEQIIKDWVKKSLGKDERMVIFIDDLDRCMPDIALMVLESMKLYLNIPKLCFVVGVDKDVVERLVVEHYKKLGLVGVEDKDKPETEEEKAEAALNKACRQEQEQKARLYLSKMFQVEIELSPNQGQMRAFLDKQLDRIEFWKDRLPEERRRMFRGLVLTLADRNPREVNRILNSALMSGAGIQMMKVDEGKPRPTFEQGLQDFFIRRILQRPCYQRIAGMIDTDEGRRFLNDWSQFALEQEAADADRLNDLLPDYARSEQPRKVEDRWMAQQNEVTSSSSSSSSSSTSKEKASIEEELRRRLGDHARYEDFELLLSEKDLWVLMLVPFSPELAEHTQPVSEPASITVENKTPADSKDEQTIHEAIARVLNKAPSQLTETDYKEVTELYLSHASVTDIKPLAKLTNLQQLDLRGTNVSDISPLKRLKNLRLLDLHGVPVTDISVVASLAELRSLNLYDTKVSDISAVGSLTNLRGLGLNGTCVSDIDVVAGLKNLQRLYLDRTKISNIRVVRRLTNLLRLGLDHTLVTDISVLDGLANLRYLGLNETKVFNLKPLNKLTGLQELLLNGTSVSDLEPLRNLTGLVRLGVSDTAVSDLKLLLDLNRLEALDLNRTKVYDFEPLRNLSALQRLYLVGTPISDIGVLSGLTNLQRLELTDTQVSDIGVLRCLTNLRELFVHNTDVSNLEPLRDLTRLVRFGVNSTSVSDVEPLKNLTALQALDLNDTKVSNLESLGNLSQMRRLYLSDTQVSDIGVLARFTNLQSLELKNTKVSDLTPLFGLGTLRSLKLSGTPVNDEQLGELKKALPNLQIEQ